jgi:hypothetical protein
VISSIFVLGLLIACGDSGVEPSDLDDIANIDTSDDVATPEPDSLSPAPDAFDTGPSEDAEDTDPTEIDDADIDTAQGDTAQGDTAQGDTAQGDTAQGDTESNDDGSNDDGSNDDGAGLGDLCEQNAECLSRVCLGAGASGYCSATCDEADDCTDGWSCRITGIDPVVQRCVRGPAAACLGCQRDSDCTQTDYRCAGLSDGDFCLPPCRDDVGCEPGYSCEIIDGAGAHEDPREPMRRCVPTARACGLCADADGDGFGLGSACLDVDCSDEDPASNPLADERCDGVDNTCEGQVDEGFDLQTDDANCGACGVQCRASNAASVCLEATCVVEGCNPGFGDCNEDGGDGCETRLNTVEDCLGCGAGCSAVNATAACDDRGCEIGECDDAFGDCNDFYADGCESSLRQIDNCGECGRVCEFANATPSCSAEGACQLRGCVTGFYDLDGSSENGCEYECDGSPALEDTPDDSFDDSNCDGIDGDRGDAVFLSIDGRPDNTGLDATSPLSRLDDALRLARSSGRTQVLIATGDYAVDAFELSGGISLYGGYDDNFATRSTRRANFTSPDSPMVLVTGLSTPVALDSLSFETRDQTAAGAASIVMWVRDSGSDLTLRRVSLNAGLGGAGGNGHPGDAAGTNRNGSMAVGSNGGAGGDATAGRGGSGENQEVGAHGDDGDRTGRWCGRGGAGGGSDSCRVTGDQSGQDAEDGCVGADGDHGRGGESVGDFRDGLYDATNGAPGDPGTDGGGGGGGGAGGGADCEICTPACTCVNCGFGRGGGGGGAAGQGGGGGAGGRSGGPSIGLVLDASQPLLFGVTIRPYVGGDGGSGGNAATGQPGGGGGGGANTTNDSQGDGGDGGRGGSGGRGGCGGSGAGGAAIAILGVNDEHFVSLGENRFPLGVAGRAGATCSGLDGESGGAGVAAELYSVTQLER